MRQHGAVIAIKKYVPVHFRMYYHIISTPELDAVVTIEPDINIEFDYPIKQAIQFPYHHDGGFTLKDVLLSVQDGYKKIYADEEKYGVWGHEVHDLFIESVEAATPTLIVLSVGV
jgi:hypothetical protein